MNPRAKYLVKSIRGMAQALPPEIMNHYLWQGSPPPRRENRIILESEMHVFAGWAENGWPYVDVNSPTTNKPPNPPDSYMSPLIRDISYRRALLGIYLLILESLGYRLHRPLVIA